MSSTNGTQKMSKSTMTEYDIVVYGATGFTGAFIVEKIATSEHCKDLTWAVAGRNETKLRSMLDQVSIRSGQNVRAAPLIIADSADESSLVAMAKQAKVIINAVGPYRLYGEAVVKAAVENGASHVDISGEPAFLETMQMKYGEQAKKAGVYVVGACGWDSIPCDLGVNFLKKSFPGDLNDVETFVQLKTGPAGYSFNAGTYQTLILGISSAGTDRLGSIRKQIMPEKIAKGTNKCPKRGQMSQVGRPELEGWALPFPGADRSIVNRSQYYDATVKNRRPVHIETYIRLESLLWTVLLAAWVVIFGTLVQFKPIRKFLQKYPEIGSCGMFKNSGPSDEQVAQAGFTYWFFGQGFSEKLPLDQQHTDRPDKKMVTTCKGPDAGYVATSGCVVSSALVIVKDKDNLPKEGGVYTTAAAFGDSKIYDYLESFGVTFQVEK